MRLAVTKPGMAPALREQGDPALKEHTAYISQRDISQVSTSMINVTQEKGRARSVV